MAQQQPGRSHSQAGGGQVRGPTLPPIRNLVSNIPPTYRAQRGLPPMIPREPGNSRPHNEPETQPAYNFVLQPPPPPPPPQPGIPGAVHPHHPHHLPPFNGHSPLGAIRHHQEAPLVHHRHHPYSPAMMVGFDFAHGQPPRTPGPWPAPAYISGPPVMGPPIPGYPAWPAAAAAGRLCGLSSA
ncbi:hypothetical protein DL89DRAFT_144352 [Linderina pennispora]|uniref:Uncharacterized protein n=1 Tax=Linderina pennispora TaxID=61395 RepID=A0A1Y1WBR9_9FUNG|nr:uncharacterized protein DL89DRAFT_144352 [Linderina pennispora]ORX70979.1 hypothetical protein DL89DRAFT_144352 [Linderina pennispora]